MSNRCVCEIRASGPESDVTQIRRLLDDHTEYTHETEITKFSDIVGRDLHRSWGWRAHSLNEIDSIVWVGELKWSPPGEFVEQMSQRFPDVVFEMKFSVNDGTDRIEIYEFKDGNSRLTYEADDTFEFYGYDMTPVDHYRVSLRFNSEAERDSVMAAIHNEGLISDSDGKIISRSDSGEVLRWVENRFHEIVVRINYWLPYHEHGGEIDPAHQFVAFSFHDGQSDGNAQKCLNWKEDGF